MSAVFKDWKGLLVEHRDHLLLDRVEVIARLSEGWMFFGIWVWPSDDNPADHIVFPVWCAEVVIDALNLEGPGPRLPLGANFRTLPVFVLVGQA